MQKDVHEFVAWLSEVLLAATELQQGLQSEWAQDCIEDVTDRLRETLADARRVLPLMGGNP